MNKVSEMEFEEAVEKMKKFRKLKFWQNICDFTECAGLLFLAAMYLYCERTQFSRGAEANIYAALLVLVLWCIVNNKINETIEEIEISNKQNIKEM